MKLNAQILQLIQGIGVKNSGLLAGKSAKGKQTGSGEAVKGNFLNVLQQLLSENPGIDEKSLLNLLSSKKGTSLLDLMTEKMAQGEIDPELFAQIKSLILTSTGEPNSKENKVASDTKPTVENNISASLQQIKVASRSIKNSISNMDVKNTEAKNVVVENKVSPKQEVDIKKIKLSGIGIKNVVPEDVITSKEDVKIADLNKVAEKKSPQQPEIKLSANVESIAQSVKAEHTASVAATIGIARNENKVANIVNAVSTNIDPKRVNLNSDMPKEKVSNSINSVIPNKELSTSEYQKPKTVTVSSLKETIAKLNITELNQNVKPIETRNILKTNVVEKTIPSEKNVSEVSKVSVKNVPNEALLIGEQKKVLDTELKNEKVAIRTVKPDKDVRISELKVKAQTATVVKNEPSIAKEDAAALLQQRMGKSLFNPKAQVSEAITELKEHQTSPEKQVSILSGKVSMMSMAIRANSKQRNENEIIPKVKGRIKLSRKPSVKGNVVINKSLKSNSAKPNVNNFGEEINKLLSLENKNEIQESFLAQTEVKPVSKFSTKVMMNGLPVHQSALSNDNPMKFSIKVINEELTKLQLKISPKSLGNITINLTREGGNISTHFIVESAEVRQMMQQAMPELRENLSQSGINLENTTIMTKDEELARQFLNRDEQNKNDGDRSGLDSDNDMISDIPLELLNNRPVQIRSPYSTVEYIA